MPICILALTGQQTTIHLGDKPRIDMPPLRNFVISSDIPLPFSAPKPGVNSPQRKVQTFLIFPNLNDVSDLDLGFQESEARLAVLHSPEVPFRDTLRKS